MKNNKKIKVIKEGVHKWNGRRSKKEVMRCGRSLNTPYFMTYFWEGVTCKKCLALK